MMTTSPGRSSGTRTWATQASSQHHWRDHAGHAEACNQRGGLAVAVREAHAQPLALRAAGMAAGHIGCGPRLVDEDEALRLQIDLAFEPVPALLQDIGTVLLDGMASLFLRVIPGRAKKRCSPATEMIWPDPANSRCSP